MVNDVGPPGSAGDLERSAGIKTRARLAIKTAIGLSLLAWLLLKTDFGEFRESLAAGEGEHLVYSIVAFFGLLALQAARLHVLIQAGAKQFASTLRLVLVGFFFNNFLPSTVGGDVYKIAYLGSGGRRWASSAALVLFDRLAGTIVVFLVGVGCLLLGIGRSEVIALFGEVTGPQIPAHWIGGALIACAAVAVVAWSLRSSRPVLRLRAGLRAGWSALRDVPPRAHLAVIGFSFASFAARIVRFVFYGKFFGLELSLGELTLVVVLLNLAGLLPLTIGGLGIQEGAIAAGLALFGTPLGLGTAVGVLNRGATWVVALVGGAIWLASGRQTADGARPRA